MASIDTAWVLIIEGLRDQAELWADVYAEAGLNAMTAATGEQRYRRARDTQPTIILLDLMLTDVDGWTYVAVRRATREPVTSRS